MKKSIPYIVIVICILAGIIYWLKGCEKQPGPDHSKDDHFVDSVLKKAVQDSLMAKTVVSHLTDSVINLRRSNDSLILTQKNQQGLVNKAGKQILGLITRIDSLKASNDISGQLKGCDSLTQLYEGAAKIIGGYEYVSDSLIDRLKLERKLSDSVKNYLWGMFTSSNNDLFAIGLKYDQLTADYKKINVKPKRWGIGPSAGAFITNKGVGYGVGVTLHYDLIKF